MTSAVEHEFNIGDFARIKHDPEKLKRMLTSIKFFKDGTVNYCLSLGTQDSYHFDFELELIPEGEYAET